MRPFYMVKLADGREAPQRWTPEASNFLLQKMIREEENKLNAQDCERATTAGIGHLVVPGKHGPELATATIGESGDYEVNATASRIKHTGADSKKAWLTRWMRFCTEPHNEEATLKEMYAAVEQEIENEAASLAAPAPTIPASEFQDQTLMHPEPPRRRGRPRKAQLQGA